MKKCFCKSKFRSLFFTATFSMIIEYVMLLSDTIIIGNMFGEDGISAVNIVSPIFACAVFVSTLNSIGTSVMYSYEIGRLNKEKANSLFGQGTIIAAASGILLFAAVLFGKELYFDFMGNSAAVRDMGEKYYSFYIFVVLLYSIYSYLIDMVYSDGDELVCNISYACQIFVNIPASIILCRKIGIGGASLGTLIGTVISICVLLCHFLRKSNSLKFVWHLSIKDILNTFKFGITDSGIYIFWGAASFLATKLVISRFGECYLPVLTLIFNVIEMTVIFDGIGQAVTPLLNVYRGEGNYSGIEKVMKTAFRTALLEGVIVSVFLFLSGGKFVALILGIKDEQLLEMSKTAIRLVCPFFVCSSVLFLMTTYYLIIEKPVLSAVITGIKDFVTLTAFMLIFSTLFGLNGIWIGFGISPLVSLIAGIIIVISVCGKKDFPLLIDKSQSEIHSFDLILTPDSIVELRNSIEKILVEKNIDKKIIYRIMLTVEEVCMLIADKNQGEKILSECSIIIKDDIQLIIRDNGVIFDITDEDSKISSLRSYVVANIMSSQQRKFHLVSTSYNRNIFCFDKITADE